MLCVDLVFFLLYRMFLTFSCPPRLPLAVLATYQGPSSPLALLLESRRNCPARLLRLRTQLRRRCTRSPWFLAQKWGFLCTNMSLRGGCVMKMINRKCRPRRRLNIVIRDSEDLPFYFEVLEFKDAESALLKGPHSSHGSLSILPILYPLRPSCQASVGHVLLKSVSNGARTIHL